MRDLVLDYYFVLRSVLKTKPHLRRCLTRCRHCRIFFITHPRNACRRDLGCPFGCQQAHRKQRSIQRSTEYYRTEPGRGKKKIQNARRRRGKAKAVSRQDTEKKNSDLEVNSHSIGGGMLAYLRVVVSLIEGRKIHRDEIEEMLKRVMRQHSIIRERRIDYILRYLKENPP